MVSWTEGSMYTTKQRYTSGALRATIPGVIFIDAIAILFAIGLIVLVVVRHQII